MEKIIKCKVCEKEHDTIITSSKSEKIFISNYCIECIDEHDENEVLYRGGK